MQTTSATNASNQSVRPGSSCDRALNGFMTAGTFQPR